MADAENRINDALDGLNNVKSGQELQEFLRSQLAFQDLQAERINGINALQDHAINNKQVSDVATQAAALVAAEESAGQEKRESRFKQWLQGVTKKQDQDEAVLEKKLERREWSLGRSTGEMMKKLGDLGADITKTMDPKNMGRTIFDQLKLVLTIFGFNLMAGNWGNILKGVEQIATMFTPTDAIGGIKSTPIAKMFTDFTSELSTNLTNFLGGKEGESLGDAIKGLAGEFVTGWFTEMKRDTLKKAAALKAIGLPEIEGDSPTERMFSLFGYVKDVLGAVFLGEDGVKAAALRKITKTVRKNQTLEGGEDHETWMNDQVEADSSTSSQHKSKFYADETARRWGKDVSSGDVMLFDSGFGEQNFLDKSDTDGDGNLIGHGAEIKQGRVVESLLSESMSGGTINTAGIIGGIGALERSVSRKGSAVVDSDFLNNFLSPFGVSKEDVPELDTKKFKLIVDDKTEHERESEGGGSVQKAILAGQLEMKALDTLTEGALKNFPVLRMLFGWYMGTAGGGGFAGFKAWLNNKTDDPRKLRLVSVDDEKYINNPAISVRVADPTGKSPYLTKSEFEFSTIDDESIQAIKELIADRTSLSEDEVNFQEMDPKLFAEFEKLLRDTQAQKREETLSTISPFGTSSPILKNATAPAAPVPSKTDLNTDDEIFRDLQEYDKDLDKVDKENPKYEGERMKTFKSNLDEMFKDGQNMVTGVVDSIFGEGNIFTDPKSRAKSALSVLDRTNAKKLIELTKLLMGNGFSNKAASNIASAWFEETRRSPGEFDLNNNTPVELVDWLLGDTSRRDRLSKKGAIPSIKEVVGFLREERGINPSINDEDDSILKTLSEYGRNGLTNSIRYALEKYAQSADELETVKVDGDSVDKMYEPLIKAQQNYVKPVGVYRNESQSSSDSVATNVNTMAESTKNNTASANASNEVIAEGLKEISYGVQDVKVSVDAVGDVSVQNSKGIAGAVVKSAQRPADKTKVARLDQ